MPYFSWQGIDLAGTIKTGVMQAASKQDLDTQLFASEIALLRAYQVPSLSFKRVSSDELLEFISSLVELLQSGLMLAPALKVLIEQTNNRQLQAVFSDVLARISQGHSFHEALEQHPTLFDAFLIHLAQAGQMSGALAETLSAWCTYMRELQEFKKKIRQALFMPIVTFAVFVLISLLIFIVILPMFVTMFQSAGQALPPLTQWMLSISDFLSGYTILIAVAIIAVLFLGYRYVRSIRSVAYVLDKFWLQIPIIGSIVELMQQIAILQTVGILLQRSVPMLYALDVASYRITNRVIAEKFVHMYQQVQQGIPLSDASLQEKLFSQETILLLVVGQESGSLGKMMLRAAQLAQQRLYKKLNMITYSVQPILLLVLGLLITGLIVAVYVPILSLSYSLA